MKITNENISFNNFDDWVIPKNFSEVSGRGEKHWLQNNDVIGLFKYPKSNQTFEYVSEHLASSIGEILNIPCAKIDIGTYRGRKGCLSYVVSFPNEIMYEGVVFLKIQYPDYDELKLMCSDGKYYSIDMIWESLVNNYLRQSFMYVPVFDFLIGNSDRHHNNWAVLVDMQNRMRLSPLYDNGSSLCAYVPEDSICSYYQDKNKLAALITSRSRSIISVNSRKKPCHTEVIKYLLQKKYVSVSDIKEIVSLLNDNVISDLLNNYSSIISENRMKLLYDFLRYKVRILDMICQNRKVDFREEIRNILAKP